MLTLPRILVALALLSSVATAARDRTSGLSAGSAHPTYAFTFIDEAPGADVNTTSVVAISNSGIMTGHETHGGMTHGFVLRDGVFTALPDVEGSRAVAPHRINQRGQIAGFFWDADTHSHGFVFEDGTFRTVDVPGAGGTEAYGINDRGVVVGFYFGPGRGFSWDDGVFTTITLPGVFEITAEDINDSGMTVGNYVDVAAIHGYVLWAGDLQTISVPGSAVTLARGVNNQGQVTGSYDDAKGTHCFVYDSGRYVTIDVPGAVVTFCRDINDRGQVVGLFEMTPGRPHSFLATPHKAESSLPD
jgi:probable HAF family extracellular repeat protein